MRRVGIATEGKTAMTAPLTPMSTLQSLRQRLARIRRGIRIRIVLKCLRNGTCLLAGFIVSSAFLDITFHMDGPQRFLLLLFVAAGIAVWLRHMALAVWRGNLSDEALARRMEVQTGAPRGTLLNALQLEERLQPDTAAFSAPIAEAARRWSDEQDSDSLLDRVRLFRNAGVVGGALALCVLVVATSPDLVGLWVRRNIFLENVRWPRLIRIGFIHPDDSQTVAHGEPFTVRLRAEGVVPNCLRVQWRSDSDTWQHETLLARRPDDTYAFSLPPVLEPIEIRAVGGDGETDWLRLTPRQRPHWRHVACSEVLPAYAGGGTRQISETDGEVSILQGSTLRITAIASEPIRAALGKTTGDTDVVLTSPGLDRVNGSVRMDRVGPLTLELSCHSRVGLESDPAYRVSLRVNPDQPPAMELFPASDGEEILSCAELVFDVLGQDDYGIEEAWIAARFEHGTTSFSGRTELREAREESDPAKRCWRGTMDLADTELAIGDVVTVQAVGRDGCDLDGPNTGTSLPITYRVVSEAELREKLLLQQRALLERVEKAAQQYDVCRTRVLEHLRADEQQDNIEAYRDLLDRHAGLTSEVVSLEADYDTLRRRILLNRLESESGPLLRHLQNHAVEPLNTVVHDLAKPAEHSLQEAVDRTRRAEPARDSLLAAASLQRQARDLLQAMAERQRSAVSLEDVRRSLKAICDIQEIIGKSLEEAP